MENTKLLLNDTITLFSTMRKKKAYCDNDEYVVTVSNSLYALMHTQIHDNLITLPNGEGEGEIRHYMIYIDEYVLPFIRDKIKSIAKNGKRLKSQKYTEDIDAKLNILQDYYVKYKAIYDDFYALSAFRNIERFALYMEWDLPETDKVWKYNINCFKGFWYYANKMLLDGTVKYLEKQLPTGYGKSFADTVMMAFIFGLNHNADVLKVVGNPSVVTDMTNKLIKYMCKPQYAKVFPYYAQFECDRHKMFDVCREGGNNAPAKFLIHGSVKGTSLFLVNKDTPIDSARFKYRFYDDITRSKDKSNINMHEKDISTYQDMWKKRKYDDNNDFEIFSGTTYHIYDFLSTIKRRYGGEEAVQSKVNKYTKYNPKYKAVFVSVPKLDWETDESTYPHKYTTEKAKADRLADYNTFMAMDMQEPMPIEGCAFGYDSLQTYKVIPHKEEEKDTECCWAMLDPARTGANYISMPIFLPIDNLHYLKDCIFEMKPMDKIYNVIISKIEQHHITRLHVEKNTDTSLATLLREKLYERGINYCNITEVYSSKKKEDKIYNNEAVIQSSMVFPEFGLYAQGSQMGKFMKYLTSFSYKEKNLYDDSIDSVAMYAEKYIAFKTKNNSITILNRKNA